MKKKIYICPNCGVGHKIQKMQGRGMALIKCECGCNSFLAVKSGYLVKSNLNMVIQGNYTNEQLQEIYFAHMEECLSEEDDEK